MSDIIEIVTMEDCIDEMLYALRNGLEKGTTTGIPMIDNCWKWRRSEFNVWSGYSNEGKSQFIRFLMIIKALENKWKFVISAPEDYPPAIFYDEVIHTITGQSTDKDNPFQVSEKRYLQAYELIKDHFTFVYLKPPNNTLEMVLEEFEKIIKEKGCEAGLIDPLVKFARPKGAPEREDLYAAYFTTLLTDFARRLNISLHLVIHQVTPQPLEGSGLYPEPSMYKIRSGGIVADATDNILFVQRPAYAKDKLSTSVIFGSQKIKKQKLTGIPQKLHLSFDRKTNRYTTEEGMPLFDFDKYLT